VPGTVQGVAEPDLTSSILGAARLVLGARGYANTTIKTVAAAAGVAPGVVRSLYSNKEQLLAAALRVPFDPAGSIPKLIAPGLDGMGERLVRLTLQLSSDEQVRKDATNLMQSARTSTSIDQLRGLTEFLQATLLDRLVEAMGVPDARMRGALITAYLAGVAATRSMLNIEPLASATDEVIVALVAPTIQRLLDPTQPLPTKDAPGKS
jgi:AcrR family transcriptional regulator